MGVTLGPLAVVVEFLVAIGGVPLFNSGPVAFFTAGVFGVELRVVF